MRDHTGEEWLTVAEAASRVFVRPGTIRVWITRGAVDSRKSGRVTWVRLDHVAAAERAWRVSGRVRGSRTARPVAERGESS